MRRTPEATDGKEAAFEEFWAAAVRAFAASNMRIVQQYAESPIEKLFLGSLVLMFIKNDPLGFFLTAPKPDTETHVLDFRTKHVAITTDELEGVPRDDAGMHRPL